MKTKKCLSLVLGTMIGISFGGSNVFQTGGSYGLPGAYLLDFAGDAAEFGRGGGNVALVDNTAALYSNPSGLGFITSLEASFVYARPLNDFNFYNGAVAYSFGKFGVVCMNMIGYRSPDAPRIDDFGIERGGTYSASDNTFSIAYGKMFLHRFNVGTTIKLATQSIDNYSGLGVGCDIGLSVKIYDWLSAGLSMINIGGPTITLITTPDHFSTTLNAGVGSRLLGDRLSLHADLQRQEILPDKKSYDRTPSNLPFHYSLGVEYWVVTYFGLRLGLTSSMVTLGTGFCMKGIHFDYAALIDRGEREFRNSLGHVFSLRYAFGKTLPQKELEINAELEDLEMKRKLRQAEQFFIDSLYAKADDTLRSFLDQYPKDPEGLRLQVRLNGKLKTQKTMALLALTRTAFAKYDYEEAGKALKKLSEISPNDPAVDSLNQRLLSINKNKEHLVFIKKLYAQGKFQEMSKELDIVLSIDSTNSEALEYRNKISKQLKKMEAEQHYNLATKYYYTDKNAEKANLELQKAITLDPDYREANDLFMKISPEVKTLYLKKLGQLVEKDNLTIDNKDLQKLVQLDGQDRIIRAQQMLSNDQFDEALSEVESVLKSDPKNGKALDLKKAVEKALSQRKAENVFNEALKLFNENQFASAETKAQTAADLMPDEQKYKGLLSDIRRKIREADIAIAKELRASGKSVDLEAAKRMVERYLETDAQNTEAQKLLIGIKVDQLIIEANEKIDKGDFQQADLTLQNALKLDPDNDKVKSAFKNLKDARAVLEQ